MNTPPRPPLTPAPLSVPPMPPPFPPPVAPSFPAPPYAGSPPAMMPQPVLPYPSQQAGGLSPGFMGLTIALCILLGMQLALNLVSFAFDWTMQQQNNNPSYLSSVSVFNQPSFYWFLNLVQAVLTGGTATLFLIWIYRARENLGPGAAAPSAGLCVGWFLIPLANLVMPLAVVGQIWRGSDPRGYSNGDLAWPAVTLWWLALVLFFICYILFTPFLMLLHAPSAMDGNPMVTLEGHWARLYLVVDVIGCVAAGLGILVVAGTLTAQRRAAGF